jgi:capsular exopolysaccharide synthesis family protein
MHVLPPNPTYSTTTGAFIESTGEPRGFDFRHFWHALLERIWIVVLCLLAGIFLAIGYLVRTPKLYQGHVVLEVEMMEPTFVNAEDPSLRARSMFLASQEALRTIEQNLTNRSLMSRVVRAEGLADDGGRALLGVSADTAEKKSESGEAASKTTGQVTVLAAFTPMEEALGGALSNMVKPSVRRGTRLIDLVVFNRDPAMAQRLTEAVGREYIRSSIERRASFNQDTLRYLIQEEERLKANLQKSEIAVAEYKAQNPDALQLGGGAAATGSQSGAGSTANRGGLVEDQLQELSSKATATKADRLRLEGEMKQIEDARDNVELLLNVSSIASAPIVADRRRDVAQLESSVAALAQRYKDKHPKMMAARAALNEAREALRRSVLAQPAVIRNTLEQSRTAEQSLEGATDEQKKTALTLNRATISYLQLARQAETDRALYESVLKQIKETSVTKDVKTNAISVIEHSQLSRMPVSPSPPKALGLGLLSGLLVGLGLVFGADLLDRSIRTVDQAETMLGLPVLAAVPEVGGSENKGKGDEPKPAAAAAYRLVAEAPEGPAAEAFRNLRAALSLLGPEKERKVFLFTSAGPNEGKSFTSANYSLALAQQGHRVLLIDGDLRRPSLHKIFRMTGPDTGAADELPGVVDYLIGEANLDTAARPVAAGMFELAAAEKNTAIGGQLWILTGGRRAPNPAELLSGPSFGKLIAEASRLFDRVVIDSAPVLAVSDTLLMTPLVQTVCVVIRGGHTPRNAIQRALGMLTGAGGRPAGTIMNRLPRRRGTGYYYYYASPGYGKGEGAYSGRYGDTISARD